MLVVLLYIHTLSLCYPHAFPHHAHALDHIRILFYFEKSMFLLRRETAMNLFKFPSWLNRGATKLGEMIASIIFPGPDIVLPPSIQRKLGVVPLDQDDLVVYDFYLHVVVELDTHTLFLEEFSPLERPKQSTFPFMPDLKGFLAHYPVGRNYFLHTEPIGLVPNERENFQRVFHASDEARSTLGRIVRQNDLAGYFVLIRDSLSWKELALIHEDDHYGKAAFPNPAQRELKKDTLHIKNNDKKLPPAPPPK